jgi:competence protein CoiA
VVWILHDRRFNRWKLSGAEQAMRHRPHYFTDMDSRGVGRVYDQWATLLRGRRISRGQKHVVDLSQPRRLNAPSFRGWTLSFAGDLQDRYAIGLSELETFSGYLHRAWGFLINMYRALFQFCLEKACR